MMTEETSILIMLVFVMLFGSYLAGSIPLVMRLSEEKLKCVTVFGAGLLVGTALTVIIPEGIRSLNIRPGNTLEKSLPKSTVADNMNGRREVFAQDHSETIGLSLVLGFVFMMLIDQISIKYSSNRDKNITATLGLVVHAAADGVALGAAATTSHQDVEIIVFLAIMLHKAPAAFGLVSFLLHEKIERLQIRKHLAIFSLSAPLMALLTYFGIGQEQKETLNSMNATGIAMLFSAGTFLYVATVHVLPELTQSGCHSNGMTTQHNQYECIAMEDSHSPEVTILGKSSQIAQSYSNKGLHCSEIIIIICGALLPLVITFGHHH